jgi:hypothetical protein
MKASETSRCSSSNTGNVEGKCVMKRWMPGRSCSVVMVRIVTSRGSNCRLNRSRAGISSLQGPHHVAQKFKTTTFPRNCENSPVDRGQFKGRQGSAGACSAELQTGKTVIGCREPSRAGGKPHARDNHSDIRGSVHSGLRSISATGLGSGTIMRWSTIRWAGMACSFHASMK